MPEGRIAIMLQAQALKSLRDSGHSLATAAAEVIDNSIEANANNINLWLFDEPEGRSKRRHISRIVTVDDGDGMSKDVLHQYPVVGFSTRYMRTDTIGKFGVGAKLAALSLGTRIDVWSRDDDTEPWRHCYFDLEQALDEEQNGVREAGVDEPDEEPVPSDLAHLLPRGTGTLVLWSNIDRLEEGRHAQTSDQLRVEVEKELSRIFRRFLNGGITISVNETALLPHDPLFLMEDTWADKVLAKLHDDRDHFPAEVIFDEAVKCMGHEFNLAITLHPPEVTRKRGLGGDKLATQLRIPENEGAISFVRLDREINYTNVARIFPRGVSEPDRFIGVEVSFTPELDEYMGVRNVKKGVEPHDEFRQTIRRLLHKYLVTARKRLDERWDVIVHEEREVKGEHGPVGDAVERANKTLPKSRAKEPDTDEIEQKLDDIAEDVVGSDSEAKERYKEQVRDRAFIIESVNLAGHGFIDTQHLGHQTIVRVNRRHRFYRELWEPIRSLADATEGSIDPADAQRTARRAVEALTLLIVTYAKAESMSEDPSQYDDLRMYWGQFLHTLLGKVKDVL